MEVPKLEPVGKRVEDGVHGLRVVGILLGEHAKPNHVDLGHDEHRDDDDGEKREELRRCILERTHELAKRRDHLTRGTSAEGVWE